MSSQGFSVPEAPGARLRKTVATIEHKISPLPKWATDEGESPANLLAASSADLVKQLALGPELEVRRGPVCGHTGMRGATLCGYCWTKRTLPTARAGGRPSERDVCRLGAGEINQPGG